MKLVLDTMAQSTIVRSVVLVGWTVITTIAFFSRYEKMTAGLTILLGTVIAVVFSFGLGWAYWPTAQRRDAAYHQRRTLL